MLAIGVDFEGNITARLNHIEWQYLRNVLYFIPHVKHSVERKHSITLKFSDEIRQKQMRLADYHDS